MVLAVLQNRLAGHVSYVGAMRAAIAVPVTALAIGAVLCLATQAPRPPERAAPGTAGDQDRSADRQAVPAAGPHQAGGQS